MNLFVIKRGHFLEKQLRSITPKVKAMHCSCNLKNPQISLKLLPINLLQQSLFREVSGNDCQPKLFEITSYQLFLHRWLSAAIQFSRIKWKIHNILFHFKYIFLKATQKVYEYGHFKRRVWHLSDLQIKLRRFFSQVTSRAAGLRCGEMPFVPVTVYIHVGNTRQIVW